MLCYSAGVDRLLPFEVNNESFGRKITSIKEFLSDYEGNRELIANMIRFSVENKTSERKYNADHILTN